MDSSVIEDYEAIIVGAGAAGLKSANELALAGIPFHIVEANSYLGGRIKTEIIEHEDQPKAYKFERGAAWIHGEKDNQLYSFFKALYEKHYPHESFDHQITRMFRGNIWVMPEYLSYEEFYLVDGYTGVRLTPTQHQLYLIIVVLHLRPLLRQSEEIFLASFVPLYLDFLAQLPHPDALPLSRAVAWYFQSIESYNGISTGEMFSSDLFHCLNTHPLPSPEGAQAYYHSLVDKASEDRLLRLLDSHESIDFTQITQEYSQTDLALEDAHTQGCGIASHCTINIGMDTVIKLLIRDTKYYLHCHQNGILTHSVVDATEQHQNNDLGASVSASFDPSLADSLDYDSISLPISLNTEVTKIGVDPLTKCPLIYTNTGRILRAKHGVILTASVNSMDKQIEFSPQSTMVTDTRNEIINSAWIVFYKKVVFCFKDLWWGLPNIKLMGVTQNRSNTYQYPSPDGMTERDLHAHHKKYLHHTKYGNDNAPFGENGQTRKTVLNSTFLDVAGGSYPALFKYARALPSDYWKAPATHLRFPPTTHTTPHREHHLAASFETLSLNAIAPPAEATANTSDSILICDSLTPPDSNCITMEEDLSPGCYFSPVNMVWESHVVNKGVNVLSCSIVGNLARQIVGLDDDVVCNMVMSHLHHIYKGLHPQKSHNMPSPLWSRVTRWGETPTMRQSYTLVVDCNQSTLDRVCGAEQELVWFAGEAIDVVNAGGIQSAISTGQIAAHRLIQRAQQSNP